MGCCSKIVAGGVLLVLGAVFLIVGCVLGFVLFPNIIQQMVAEKVMLRKGSPSWDMWKQPIPMSFEVYFFNVTNVDEINMGKKPVVKEVGPYVYKEYKEKHDIVIDEISGTASYYQKTLFEFDAEASAPLSDSDNVTIIHVAIMGAALTVETMGPLFIWGLNLALETEKDVFLTGSVKNILFEGAPFLNCTGFLAQQICEQVENQHIKTVIIGPDSSLLFSLFSYKNNTDDGRYEVKLGWDVDGPNPTVKGVKLIGKIVRWENSTELRVWEGDTCNELTGTDATIFPPFLTEDSRIDIFSTDLCRSLTALYDKDSSYQGIDSLRFTAHERLLADVRTNPDNYCYCPPNEGCLLKGALDLTPCQGAPAVLTFPHFYLAGEKYLEMVDGLKPNKELHETFLDIEPNTGVPLQGGKKMQFNMMMKSVKGVKITENLTTVLFPIAWINEGVALDDANVKNLKDQLVDNLTIVTGVTWALIGVGIAMMIVGLCFLLYAKCHTVK